MLSSPRQIAHAVAVAAVTVVAGFAQGEVILGSLDPKIVDPFGYAANSSGSTVGQTFITPTSGADFKLSEFTFQRGAGGFFNLDGATGTQDAIYLNIYIDNDGDLNTGSRTFVASSTNTADHDNSSPGDALQWAFDDVQLAPNTKYWAVLSGTTSDGDFFAASLKRPETNDNTAAAENFFEGGAQVYVPTFGPTDVIEEQDDSFSGPRDLLFEAVLVPEPGSLSLVTLGGWAVLARRRQG